LESLAVLFAAFQTFKLLFSVCKAHFADPADLSPIFGKLSRQVNALNMLNIANRGQNACNFIAISNAVVPKREFGQKGPNASPQETNICNGMIIFITLLVLAVNYSSRGA